MPAGRRYLRRLFSAGVPLIGVAIILASALNDDPIVRVALGAFGSLLILLTTLAIQEKVLPNDRRLVALRAEIEDFMGAVRRTNAYAVATSEQRGEIATFHAACEDLVQRARHIGTVAAATHGLPSPDARD